MDEEGLALVQMRFGGEGLTMRDDRFILIPVVLYVTTRVCVLRYVRGTTKVSQIIAKIGIPSDKYQKRLEVKAASGKV